MTENTSTQTNEMLLQFASHWTASFFKCFRITLEEIGLISKEIIQQKLNHKLKRVKIKFPTHFNHILREADKEIALNFIKNMPPNNNSLQNILDKAEETYRKQKERIY